MRWSKAYSLIKGYWDLWEVMIKAPLVFVALISLELQAPSP